MTETNEGMYTSTEVAKILNISTSYVNSLDKKGILKPTDIVPSPGIHGYKHMYNAESIYFCGRQIGREPSFEAVGTNEDEIKEDGSIVLTPENFERIVHGATDASDNAEDLNRFSGDAKFLRRFMASNNVTLEDLTYITGKSENTARRLMGGLAHLQFKDVMALCAAAKVSSVDFDIDDYFANDPERLKELKAWVPYERAKLMNEYARLQARMKQIEKELGGSK